jgi:uncharacterized protein (DUF1684 family)
MCRGQKAIGSWSAAMNEGYDFLALADWRRRVGQMYADVRRAPEAGRVIAWHEWRAARNELFRNHSQSPLDEGQRARFKGLAYYPYDPAWRIQAVFESDNGGQAYDYQLGADGDFTMRRVGWVTLDAAGIEGRLGVYWIEGYGGGLFLPFKDATGGGETYGGGRYLYDTIKGADLGADGDGFLLDFNYAYNPSCAYSSHFSCPLPPRENRLTAPIRAGEKDFK